jgi:hypothetical protein
LLFPIDLLTLVKFETINRFLYTTIFPIRGDIMKKTITFVLLMLFCAVSVFAVTTPSSFNIAVGDTADASDVILASDVAKALQEEGHVLPVGVTKLFSEVNAQMDKQVLLIIYEKEAVIVVGATSSAEYVVFATKLKTILEELGVRLIGTILNTEVKSDDLTRLFEGSQTSEPVVIIKEEVKCVFSGSTTTQECYTTEPDDIKCRGVEACTATVYGPKDTNKKITWKSSCGGYAYTIVDGNNEYAKFDCASSEVPTCKDSDGGKDYYEKGEIYLSGMGSRVDKCDGSTLLEYYCDECLKGLPCNYAKNYECPNGCRDGACIKGSTSSPILGGELIFYYMDTCPYSQMTAPVIVKLTSELGITLRKVKVNVFDPNEVEETGIRATPTMIYKKGDCVKENSGAKPYDTLKEWILEGPCVEQADEVGIPSQPVPEEYIK